MKKNLKLILLTLLLVSGAAFFFYKNQPVSVPPKESAQTQAILIINYGNGTSIQTSFVPHSGQTVFDVLKLTAEEKNITLETKQYDFGIFVKSIGGYESTAEMAWIYFVNGNSGQVAADKQEIKSGDIIEWRYVKPTE